MKKQLSAILSLLIAAGSLSLSSASAADALLHAGFESGLDGWAARGTATVAQSSTVASQGSGSASVSNRSESWCGIGYSLDTSVFKPGTAYSFSAAVTQQASPMAVHFKLSLQYSTGGGGNPFGGGGDVYDHIAEGDAASGMWTTLSNTSYTIPADAQNPLLYIETDDSTADFFVDEIIIAAAGTTVTPDPTGNFKRGDANHDGKVDAKDTAALRDYLIAKKADGVNLDTADLDGNGKLNGADLTLLKRLLLAGTGGGNEETTAPPVIVTDPPTQTTVSETPSGAHMSAKEYMAKVGATMTQDVPGNVTSGKSGTCEHFTYFSKKANHDKGAYYWIPSDYSASKKYNLLIMNHGIFGDESSMLSGFGVQEMASNMIASGEAEPFIIIFTQMYTDPATQGSPGFNITMDVMDKYDDFIYDVVESIIPYAQEHWSVMPGRDHTAIAGFSMGGRESLYCGIVRPDVFGYVCASSPAPGIVPASDSFLANHLGSYNWERTARLKNEDFKVSDDKCPYLIMIAGGTNDGVVGTFPQQYHELLDKNGTPNLWMSVAGGGHDGGVGTKIFYNFFRAMFKA